MDKLQGNEEYDEEEVSVINTTYITSDLNITYSLIMLLNKQNQPLQSMAL